MGMSNYGGWSDAAFDAPARAAQQAMDDGERDRLMREASRIALKQMPVIPLHFESGVWAFRKGLAFAGRVDQTTPAAEIRAAD